jgi:sugar lactone lactonase YvrE
MLRCCLLSLYLCILGALTFVLPTDASATETHPALVRVLSEKEAVLRMAGSDATLRTGERIGQWTLMQILPAGGSQHAPARVVLEDFSVVTGHLLVIDTRGVQLDLPKTAEPTSTDTTRHFLGHTLAQVMESPTDLLGDALLAAGHDPLYEDVAAALPPIRKMQTYSFVGTPENRDKIPFEYGGRTANFDPAPYYPGIGPTRDRGHVLDGLVGGWLPVLRFVYPGSPGDWCEMIAFAPFRKVNPSGTIQPVWYRIARVEHGELQWVKYVDSYHPFPPRMEADPALFWTELIALRNGWEERLAGAMQVVVPDDRVASMARFGLVREMMTRTGDFPHYGVVDRNYAASEHDGFPDTFTAGTEAMLAWGLTQRAGRYIDNYFSEYVRDDGSLLYRGPETGQYGRMLTLLARYVENGGEGALLLKHRRRIDAVTRILLHLRSKAKTLLPEDPAYGMIAGWSEADAALDADPPRYMQPYFGNSTTAARGFADLGRVWQRLGRDRRDKVIQAWGAQLMREGRELQEDCQRSIGRSILHLDGETVLPAIAGVREPFHIAVQRDGNDPQCRSYRAYMEMLHSGNLTREQVEAVVAYRARHHDQILGMPTAYGLRTGELAGFLSYGIGYGLIQHDMIPRALLLLWSDMAHGHTRGGWTAPETRTIRPEFGIAPYATPAQLVVPMMMRWMLVFEDPVADTVWLGKAVPRQWLAQGKEVHVAAAPTRFGRVGFAMRSFIDQGRIDVDVQLPPRCAAVVQVRCRVPEGHTLRSATVDGKPWTHIDPVRQTITLPAGTAARAGTVKIVAHLSSAPTSARTSTPDTLQRIATGFQFVEGPVWNDSLGLLFSDVWPSTIYRWSPTTPGVTVFMKPSDSSNGLTFDRQGSFVLTQMQKRRVSRRGPDGSIIPLASGYRGQRFNSPNDIIVSSSGAILFTDPDFNVPRGESTEIGFQGVYRLRAAGTLQLIDSTLDKPNGLCLSPDEKHLYVNESARHRIYAWDVVNDSTFINKRLLYTIPREGYADGMKADSAGNIYCTGPGGIWVVSAAGALVTFIATPEGPTNCAWGDADGKTLYITASTSVYRIRPGLAPGVKVWQGRRSP